MKKAGLKLNIHKAFTGIMASNSITSWQIDGETMKIVTNFIFLGSKITVGGDRSYEIKGCLLFGRKAMINLGSILKSRDITLPRKVCSQNHSQSYGVSSRHIQMWELSHKKGWCWERLKAGGERDNREQDGWMHHLFSGYEFEQTLGDVEGPGSLAFCIPWGHK